MSINNKQWLGLPLNLLWGYIAIAVFMTGDGFELAFLSHYIKALGFSGGGLLCLYPLRPAALSAWISGVVAEIITPLKTMMIGFVLWCVFHVLFLVFGLGHANYALILLFYGIRASPIRCSSTRLSWRLSITSKRQRQLGHRLVLGGVFHRHRVFGSYIPSFTIPHIGEMAPCGWRWPSALPGRDCPVSCAIFKRRSICRISPPVRSFPSWDAPRRCSIPTAIFCCRAW